jgi:uncharacterized BrkB/YihY/UPF0761 family membrane protein
LRRADGHIAMAAAAVAFYTVIVLLWLLVTAYAVVIGAEINTESEREAPGLTAAVPRQTIEAGR